MFVWEIFIYVATVLSVIGFIIASIKADDEIPVFFTFIIMFVLVHITIAVTGTLYWGDALVAFMGMDI